MRRELRLSGGAMLSYELTRKKVKRINVQVRMDGSVTVSAPQNVPLAQVEAFLREKERFLLTAMEKTAARQPVEAPCCDGGTVLCFGRALTLRFRRDAAFRAEEEDGVLRLTLRAPESETARRAALERWQKERCAAAARRLLQKWLPVLTPWGVPEPTLRFRRMTSRWGSCVPQRRSVTLNTRLLDYPEECLEAVLLHELCHFLQPDHSAAFYRWMDRFLPDWRQRRRLLG